MSLNRVDSFKPFKSPLCKSNLHYDKQIAARSLNTVSGSHNHANKCSSGFSNLPSDLWTSPQAVVFGTRLEDNNKLASRPRYSAPKTIACKYTISMRRPINRRDCVKNMGHHKVRAFNGTADGPFHDSGVSILRLCGFSSLGRRTR